MPKLRRLNDRNQITLPPSVLREAGVGHGALFSIDARDGKIILVPKKVVDDDYTQAELDALDRLVKRQLKAGAYTEYASPKEALKHLRRK